MCSPLEESQCFCRSTSKSVKNNMANFLLAILRLPHFSFELVCSYLVIFYSFVAIQSGLKWSSVCSLLTAQSQEWKIDTDSSEEETLGRGESGCHHIFVNPELRLKPSIVVIIKITVHHIKFGKVLIDHKQSLRRRGHLVLKRIVVGSE